MERLQMDTVFNWDFLLHQNVWNVKINYLFILKLLQTIELILPDVRVDCGPNLSRGCKATVKADEAI